MADTFVPPAAAQALVRDLRGEAHPLSTLWARQPVVAAWVRHFG